MAHGFHVAGYAIAMPVRFDVAPVSGRIDRLPGLRFVARWPYSSLYTLGTCLGIDLIFIGSAWLSIGLALKKRA